MRIKLPKQWPYWCYLAGLSGSRMNIEFLIQVSLIVCPILGMFSAVITGLAVYLMKDEYVH